MLLENSFDDLSRWLIVKEKKEINNKPYIFLGTE